MSLTLKESLGGIKKGETVDRGQQLEEVVADDHRGFIVDVLEKEDKAFGDVE
jgi:hypothetical protein